MMVKMMMIDSSNDVAMSNNDEDYARTIMRGSSDDNSNVACEF